MYVVVICCNCLSLGLKNFGLCWIFVYNSKSSRIKLLAHPEIAIARGCIVARSSLKNPHLTSYLQAATTVQSLGCIHVRGTSYERMVDLRHDCADIKVIAALPVLYSGISRIKKT